MATSPETRLHARSAVAELPMDVPVEVELLVETHPDT